MRLLFTGVGDKERVESSAQLTEDIKMAAEKAEDLKRKNAILNKIAKTHDFINVIGDHVKDASTETFFSIDLLLTTP